MFNFLRLCINESVKILKKKSTFIFGTVIFICLFLCYIYTNFVIEQNLYPGNDKEFFENDYRQKKMVENMKANIIKIQNDKKALNTSKAYIEYYQYATDNNIHLFSVASSNIINEYWKYNIIQKLIELKVQLYELQDSKNDLQKFGEVSKQIENLTTMLKNEDYNKYIDFRKNDCEEQYKNGKMTIYQRDIAIYILELNRKYGTTRYNDDSNLWKYNSISRIEYDKSTLINGENYLSFDEKNSLNENINLEIYRLEHNIAINNIGLSNYNDLYIEICEKVILSIFAIFIIITACNSIASEFSKGTIKQILITPNKRWKILLSKIVTLTFILVIFSVILSLIVQLFGNIFFGEHHASSYVYISNGQINVINNILYNVFRFLAGDIKIFIYMLFAFMLGIIIRNSAVITGISVFIYTGDTIFMQLINNFLTKQEWIKFIPFNNFDLIDRIFPNASKDISSIFGSANLIVDNIPLCFSVGVILVSALLLITTSFESFKKREIF